MMSDITFSSVEDLFSHQLQNWRLLAANYAALSRVEVKEFQLSERYVVKVQFNPARIVSSAAKVDKESVSQRPCFLCHQNRPTEQEAISFGEDYQILVNPYPIFPKHFTIPTVEHTPQTIMGRFGDMLNLSRTMDQYVIFYNGPRCGASAPDHAHFQAGSRGFLPIERDINDFDFEDLGNYHESVIRLAQSYTHPFFLIQSSSIDDAAFLFSTLVEGMSRVKEESFEPMLNILAWYLDDQWLVAVFPRKLHRPSCYFETDATKRLLISPASVDMGGVFIVPQRADFDKVTGDDIQKILNEVCYDEEMTEQLVKQIKSCL